MSDRRALRVLVRGTVQGVGFRPFVYRLAGQHALAGWVRNHPSGVELAVEGPSEELSAFLEGLHKEAPPLARIEAVQPADAALEDLVGFQILHSRPADGRAELPPPDVATCRECLEEVLDPRDRRHRYPFTNCTNCGPRFTIVQGLPYDRPLTTMAGFRMCARCLREYEDPADRRFHAQPNACPECGPRLQLVGRDRIPVAGDPVEVAGRLLAEGRVLAVKGLGGFHLAADALKDDAVERLRQIKGRAAKPFALMVRDLQAARSLCRFGEDEARLLESPARPIVVLDALPGSVAASVAPRQNTLGIMLPYSPLHHLLLRSGPSALVLTSGNRSEEPLIYLDSEGLDELAPRVDATLLHDRPIHARCDDSVVRWTMNAPVLLRRSRGYVPTPIRLDRELARPVLACGGQQKVVFALGQGHQALLSAHVGDLDDYRSEQAYRAAVEHMERLSGLSPEVQAHDAHPDYATTRYARERGLPTLEVQHHHAHLASVLVEHALDGPVLGVIWDGTGYGLDGTVWGGEFLLGDRRDFTRVAHLECLPMPGGELAVRQPWRMALACLYRAFGEDAWSLDLPVVRGLEPRARQIMERFLSGALPCPLTSSMGRLLDAAAALILDCREAFYSGQPAIELEAAVAETGEPGYPLEPAGSVLLLEPFVRALVADLVTGVPAAVCAARVHQGVVEGLLQVVRRQGCDRVALSGGVFQNRWLLENCRARLERSGIRTYANRLVPPNDGGLALGQLAVAAARL
ncbi:MAG: carbamoyltransferase HypF [Candidatus Eremiobacterota bacterium]